jgi:hypothetical protein
VLASESTGWRQSSLRATSRASKQAWNSHWELSPPLTPLARAGLRLGFWVWALLSLEGCRLWRPGEMWL